MVDSTRTTSTRLGLGDLEPLNSGSIGEAQQIDVPGNPFVVRDSAGLIDQEISNLNRLQDVVTDPSQFEEPEQVDLGPQVLFSPSTKKLFINGATMDVDDYQSALDSKEYLNRPAASAPMDVAQDWIKVSPESFTTYIQSIKNPTTSNLMARNFGIGVDNLKLLAGRGLQFYGKEETGKEWVDEALADLYKNQPFQREFQNETGEFVSNGLVDWFVANLAQQGPMILESIAVALAGGVAGGLAGGGANPFTAFGGTVSALMGKESFKQGVLAAAKKYSLNQSMTDGEKKLLREVSGMAGATKVKNDVKYNNPFTGKKNRADRDDALEYAGFKFAEKAGRAQGRIGGAAGASILGAQQLGQADIYGEVLETGVGDRGTAFLGSFPYAAAEVIPEFFLAGKVLGLNPAKMKTGADVLKRGPKNIFRRAGEGIAVGGALEGATELAQESILLGGTDQLGDAGTYRRLLNAFAAGFAIGGPIGGIANLKTDKTADILNPEGNKEPEPTKPKTEPEPPVGTQGELFGPEVTSRTRDIRRNPTGVPEPTPPVPPVPPQQLDLFDDNPVAPQPVPTQPEVSPDQLELDLAGQQPIPTGQGSLLTPTGRARNTRRQQPTPVAAAAPIPAPNPILQTVQAGQGTPTLDNTQTTPAQPEVKPETDINNDLYKLNTGRTLSTLDQQELIAQRDRLIGKKKLTPREDKDLQAVTAAISRREANMTTSTEQNNRLQQVVNEQKQRDKLNKQNAKILKQAERNEAKRKKAEEKQQDLLRKEQVKQAQAETKRREAEATAAAERPTTTSTGTVETASRGIVGGRVLYELSESFNSVDVQAEIDNAELTESFTPMPSGGVNFVQLQGTKEQHERFVQDAGGLIVSFGDDAVEAMSDFTIRTMPEKGGAQDANQEQSPAEVAAEESTTDSGGVAERNQQEPEAQVTAESQEDQGQAEDGSTTTRQESKAEQLKRGRQDRKEQVAESTNRSRENRVATPKPTKDPATVWASLGTVLSYDAVSPELKQQFESDPSFTKPEINKARLQSKYSQLALKEFDEQKEGLSNAEIIIDAQAEIEGLQGETTSDVDKLRDAIAELVTIGYFGDNANPNANRVLLNNKSERQFVTDFLLNTQFTDQQLDIIREEFIAAAMLKDNLSMQTKGVPSQWVGIAERLDAMDAILNQMGSRVRNKPAKYQADQGPATDKVGQDDQSATNLNEEVASNRLVDLITEHINGKTTSITNLTVTSGQNKGAKNSKIVELENLFAGSDPGFIVSKGLTLGDFFDKDGNLNLGKSNIDGRERFVPKPIDKDAGPTTQEIIDEADSNTGRNYRYDSGQEIKNPVPKGKAELIVKQILKKFKTKPTVTVVRNKQELRETNPKLYERAAAARDDFETVKASGYSVGDQIIIFTDFVKDEQTLRSIVGHEALGHFGFSAFVPRAKLKLILDDIYQSDPAIRALSDQRIGNGEERYEAIEEVLADYASHVDSHILARFWNAVKNFMRDVFGREYQDDMTRYLVFQSRNNLRTGGSGVVSVYQMVKNLERLKNESTYGRYNAESSSAAAYKSLTNQIITLRGEPGGLLGYKSWWNSAKRTGKQLTEGDASSWFGKVLEEFQTLDNIALRSEGLSKIFSLFQGQTARTRKFQQIYANMTKFTHSLDNSVLNKLGITDGPTQQELIQAGELLAYFALYRSNVPATRNENAINNAESLITTNSIGENVINEAAFERMKAEGMMTKEELAAGFEVTLDILQDGTENVNGDKLNYKPNFVVTDRIYKIFEENRNAVNEAAKDLLESNLEATISERQDILSIVKDFAENKRGIGASAQDQAAATVIVKKYQELYSENAKLEGVGITYDPESQKNAELFLRDVNRALWKKGDENKLNDWIAGDATEVDIFKVKGTEDFTDVVNSLQQLHEVYSGERSGADQVTKTIENLLLLDLKNVNNEFNAKRTILGGYVPFTRRGNYQVTLRAFDDNDNEIELDSHTKNVLPYYQVDSKQDARELFDSLKDDFKDTKYKFKDKNLQDVEVNLKPETSEVSSSAPLSSAMNLNEFTSILVRLNVNLKPEQMKKVTTALTKQSERARKSLQRSGTAGWNADVVRSVSEHLETMSHAAGKTFYSHKLNKYTTDEKLWAGNRDKLNRLKERMEKVEATGSDEQIKIAQQQYDSYANQYRYSAGLTDRTITVYKGSGKNREAVQVKTEGQGKRYRSVAGGLLDFYGKAGNIDVSTEDLLSGEAGSFIKLLTVTSQLGGSVATGFVNTISMVSHSIPYLSTYNAKTGYGGGFGLTKSAGAMTRALRHMKNFKLETLTHMQELVKDTSLQDKYGITQDEAQVLLEATEQGVLQAAQFNALVGTARGGLMANKNLAGVVRGWMKVFSYTEQLNRRTTFLAAYRLQRDKLQKAGDLKQDEIQKSAEEFAIRAVNTSQGEYGMFNRPAMARGNVLQYIFMYKQFVIITVELMKNLGRKEQLAMLTLLVLMSGLKGLPFADDITDLIDTLTQKFGFKTATVEKNVVDFIEEIAPGASPVAMRGFLDYFLGATVSTRLGFGDLIPLTGVGKAGADPWQEAKNFLGPVWSAGEQTAGTLSLVAAQGAEAIGLKSDTTTWTDVLKNQPFGALRGVTDGIDYATSGQVTNKEGKVIMDDVSTLQTVFRFLNFYPAGATYQNDIIRMSKQTDGFAKAIKKSYTDAWVKAKINKDRKTMRQIEREVKEHNQDHRGTEFELKRWLPSAQRAFRAWSMPAAERYKKFAPKNIRPETQFLMDAYEQAINDH